jgi:hypothetical protein
MFLARIVVCDSSAVLPLYLRCADEQTLPHGWKIVEFSMLEPESRIELLYLFITSETALNAVLTRENPTFSTVFDVRCAQSYLL